MLSTRSPAPTTACACSHRRPPTPPDASPPASARSGNLQRGRDPGQLVAGLRGDQLAVELVVALDQLEDLVVHLRELLRQCLPVAIDGVDTAAQPPKPA